jgi:hypothetical protein
MLSSLLRRLSGDRLLRIARRLDKCEDPAALAAFAEEHRGHSLGPALRAFVAVRYLRDDDPKGARRALVSLYAELKSAEIGVEHYVKLYCLYHFAVLRDATSDAIFYSRKVRQAPASAALRAFLHVPRLKDLPRPGTAVTATL